MAELNFRLMLITDGADGKLHAVEKTAADVKANIETPATVNITATKALETIRDAKIAMDGVFQAIRTVTMATKDFLDNALEARQSMTLSNITFKSASNEMLGFSQAMQQANNVDGDKLLALMAKMETTFKLSTDEIKMLTPGLLDFTEATKVTGMTVESAFDLMGRALNGHTEMLGKYGIELDKNRLASEGVSYLVEKLGEDYGGTAAALADLRTQNQYAWGDIKESIGDMLQVIINPLLGGLKSLMEWFNNLTPALKGLVAGVGLAIPIIATLATTITAVTAAITALKAVINPVVGIISAVVGVVSMLGLTYAATRVQTDDLATSQKSLKDEINESATAVSTEAEKFNLLATQLLDLKSKTTLTKEEKVQLSNIIKTINGSYGEYLGNINLETAGYNDLTTALNNASNALIQQQIAKIYGDRYKGYVDSVAQLTIKLKEQQPEYERLAKKRDEMFASFPKGAMDGDNPMGFNPDAWTKGDWGNVINQLNKLGQTSSQLFTAKQKLNEFAEAYAAAVKNAGNLVLNVGSDANPTTTDTQIADYERLLEELRTMRFNDTQKLEEDYAQRNALILKYTVDGSAEEKAQLSDLAAWKELKQDEINAKFAEQEATALAAKKQATQDKFTSEIDYYSNLESLGINSYDAMKKTMEEYYAWAKENLTKEEQAFILLQLQQTNLRWGQLKAREAEEAYAKEEEHARIRDEFRAKELDLAGSTYDLQLIEIDNYYASRLDKLRAAGFTEEQITAQSEAAKAKIRESANSRAISGMSGMFGSLAGLFKSWGKKGFRMWQMMASAQALLDTFSAAMGAYKAMVGIPVVGPGLAAQASAIAYGVGVANVAAIWAQNPPEFALGGPISGPSHSGGGVHIEAEGGEYIASKERVNAIGKPFFDFLNFAPLSQVKSMLSSIPSMLSMPSIPLPAYSFASGGSVLSDANPTSSNAMYNLMSTLISEVQSLKSAFIDSRPITHIHIDPLDPVKVSEIADTGKILRSTY